VPPAGSLSGRVGCLPCAGTGRLRVGCLHVPVLAGLVGTVLGELPVGAVLRILCACHVTPPRVVHPSLPPHILPGEACATLSSTHRTEAGACLGCAEARPRGCGTGLRRVSSGAVRE